MRLLVGLPSSVPLSFSVTGSEGCKQLPEVDKMLHLVVTYKQINTLEISYPGNLIILT